MHLIEGLGDLHSSSGNVDIKQGEIE